MPNSDLLLLSGELHDVHNEIHDLQASVHSEITIMNETIQGKIERKMSDFSATLKKVFEDNNLLKEKYVVLKEKYKKLLEENLMLKGVISNVYN